jgi:hypothetical protein
MYIGFEGKNKSYMIITVSGDEMEEIYLEVGTKRENTAYASSSFWLPPSIDASLIVYNFLYSITEVEKVYVPLQDFITGMTNMNVDVDLWEHSEELISRFQQIARAFLRNDTEDEGREDVN